MTKKTKKRIKPSDHAGLLDEINHFLGRFLVLGEEQKVVLSAYVLHTYIAKHCQQTPYIFIHSPEPECGKSRLMEVLETLVFRPWMIVNPSDAVLFRKVSDKMPTLLWDEIDAVFNPKQAQNHEEQRGMLDQGHRRHGRVPRFINGQVVEFDVYCPKVFAGIGTLPDTLSRRSVPISLKRKRTEELVEDFIYEDVKPQADLIRDRLITWADENGKAIASTRPTELPTTISDRMREGCFSLFAIADALGQGNDFRKALEFILTGDRTDSAETMRMRLLRDLRLVFAEERAIRGAFRGLSTSEIIEGLNDLEESPWRDYYGRGIEPKDIAGLLAPYGVKSVQVKLDGQNIRGYRREGGKHGEGLVDVWRRYLGADDTEVVLEGDVDVDE
ncbi:hypothetical protein CFH99_16650 [Nocardioides aromaticivorans]|uniref:DUF3631 domain-containing protein n=1 Tax=Nocardioides aromaticivorans TaxID=200618 RepID=A0ABX7PN93_9ACTN|nr:DUF3631 domain-containing protein [Nocardioides aromaticivorans]QSR27252.1 hypothetical protein CFH99_16650 [Nocardioides aromaticivorans]